MPEEFNWDIKLFKNPECKRIKNVLEETVKIYRGMRSIKDLDTMYIKLKLFGALISNTSIYFFSIFVYWKMRYD